jgi:hypothetical protein
MPARRLLEFSSLWRRMLYYTLCILAVVIVYMTFPLWWPILFLVALAWAAWEDIRELRLRQLLVLCLQWLCCLGWYAGLVWLWEHEVLSRALSWILSWALLPLPSSAKSPAIFVLVFALGLIGGVIYVGLCLALTLAGLFWLPGVREKLGPPTLDLWRTAYSRICRRMWRSFHPCQAWLEDVRFYMELPRVTQPPVFQINDDHCEAVGHSLVLYVEPESTKGALRCSRCGRSFYLSARHRRAIRSGLVAERKTKKSRLE